MRRYLIAGGCVLALLLTAGCTGAGTAANGHAAGAVAQQPRLTVPPMDSTGSGGNFRSLKSVADTSTLPDALVVYKVKDARVGRDVAAGHARKLGIEAAVEEVDGRFVAAGRGANFEMDKVTGSFDFTTKDFEKQTKPIKASLSDADYRKRAEKFLQDSGLMPGTAEFRDVNRGNVVGTFEGGKWVERPYMIEVRFGHKPLKGIPFDKGVGPKVVVQFGEDGAIIGAMSVWREVEPFATYPLKNAKEALAAARDGNAQLFDVGTDEDGVVDKIELSYMNEPLGYAQRYVLPAYVLRGAGREGRRFTGIVQAVPDNLLLVDPSLSKP
jgi:hypothetical protein